MRALLTMKWRIWYKRNREKARCSATMMRRLPQPTGATAFTSKWDLEKMGTKVTKPNQNDQVTKFTAPRENSETKIQRPPSGMPNPKEEPQKMTFLSVPSAVYIDDDSISSISADTSFLTKSSESSINNLASSSTEGRRSSLRSSILR